MQRLNTNPFRFIVIEGIDGVGKTTVANHLCRSLGYWYYKTPPTILENFNVSINGNHQSLRGFVDTLAYSLPQARYLFYLFGLVVASQEIEEILHYNHVVCDRYFASTLAYHWALDPQLRLFNIDWLSIVRPDFQFLLTIHDEEEHKRRLKERESPKSDLLLEQNILFLQKVQSEFERLGLIQIDVSSLSVDKVVGLISKIVLSNE